MKKFKKFIAMGCAAIMALSVATVNTFAYSNAPETRISYYHPTQFLDISTPFTDIQPNKNGITGTCYSDFYFNCGAYKKVTIRDYAMTANKSNDYITIQILDKTTGDVIDSIQNIRTGPNMNFSKTITFDRVNQEFFVRIFINGGTYIKGGYTIVQTI